MLFVQRSGWAMVSTGNPYKELVACLMKRGVQIELCGAMAAVVNTNAIARMSQLVHQEVRSNHGWD
jgi:hypothetical protein